MSDQRAVGLMVVDKPSGMTSHDVVERARRALDARVGHAGTLDPQATGVLLLCIGAATRMARFLQTHDKVYEGVVRLGWATDTYDAEGEAVAEPVAVPALEAAAVRAVLDTFVGVSEQQPPVYSAKKIRGQPAYRRARRGAPVAPAPVTIEVHSLELTGLEGDEIHIKVHCESGTYVRTLAQDIGVALGIPAHLAALRRTRSGCFSLDRAVSCDDIENKDRQQLLAEVLPPALMVPDWPAAVLTTDGIKAVANGGMVEPGWIAERRPGVAPLGKRASPGADGWVRLLDDGERMIAAGELVPGGLVQPRIVLR